MNLEKDGFYTNGRKSYLFSGEIHYFRIEKKNWKSILKKMKDCGLNTVSFYIPWAWHEYKEGKFDFSGKTDPKRDLISFLDLTKELNFYTIVRPGPYNFAELLYKGIPKWFIDKYPNTLMLDDCGNIFGKDIVSFLHPIFLEYTKRWYNKILPLLRDYQIPNGGNISFLQICNEIGSLPFWLGQYDYNPETLGLKEDGIFPRWLEDKFGDINTLNQRYNSNYSQFLEIEPPKGAWRDKYELRRRIDWDEFYVYYHKKYVDILYNYIKDKDIDVPIPLNIPNPHETMRFRDIFRSYNPKEVFCGYDLYYVFGRGMDHESLSSLAVFGMEMSKIFFDVPPSILELICGFFNDYPRVYHNQLDVFYHTLFAHGLEGASWYLFAGGKNPKKLGETRYHYWQAPIGPDGEINRSYYVIKDLIKKLKEKDVINTKKVYDDITIGINTDNFFGSYLYRKLNASDKFIDPREFYDSFMHLFLTLFVNNIYYRLVDLKNIDKKDLKRQKFLWVVSTEFMDKSIQKKLIEYVEGGGNLILNPTCPKFDQNIEKTDLFSSILNISQKSIDTCQIDILGYEDVNVKFTHEIESRDDLEIVANYDDKNLGFIKRIGTGKILFLGFMWEYKHKYQSRAILDLLDKFGFRQNIKCDEEIQIVKREGKNDLLFMINYHPIDIEFSYSYFGKKYSDKLDSYECRILKLQ